MTSQDIATRTGYRLAYLLKHAERRLATLHEEVLAPLDIDVRDLGVLMVIDGFEPASQQQLAERMGVDRTTMVAIIDALERKGIIARRPDADDRRRNLIGLTTSGGQLLRRATAASDTAEAKLLTSLTPAEATELRTLMARVVDEPPVT